MTRNDSIRAEVLLQFYGAQGLALSAEMIQRECDRRRFHVSAGEIRFAITFLESDGCIVRKEMPGQSSAFYTITARGVRAYEENYSA